MTSEAISHTLNLTLGELLFVARQMGVERFPVWVDDVNVFSADELEAEQRAGRELLETRGLLRPTAAGAWQLDGFLALAAQWLSAPEHTLSLRRTQRGGGVFPFTLYFKQQKALLVEYRHSEFRLSMFMDDAMLQQRLGKWMGLALQDQRARPLPALSRAAFLAVQSALASDADLPSAWESVQFASGLTWVNWTPAIPRVERDLGFVGNETELWQVECAASDKDSFEFNAVTVVYAQTSVRTMWPVGFPKTNNSSTDTNSLPDTFMTE